MGALPNILIVVCIIFYFTFVTIFGRLPVLQRTPIGFLDRLIWKHIPGILSTLDLRFTNGRIFQLASRLVQPLLYKKHPIVFILFLFLLSGGACLFIPATWPLIPWYHKLAIPILLSLPYIFTYLCNKSGPDAPHIITPVSCAQNVLRYPYDYKLFHPNMYCTICQLPKPARSKHCSRCRVCIARADHHCIWVNNCLGYGNYKHFLALLLSLTVLLAYTALLAYLTLAPQVRDHSVQYAVSRAKQGITLSHNRLGIGAGEWADRVLVPINGWLDTLTIALLIGGVARGGIGLLALLTAPLPAGLFGYHVYLLWAGMTTSENSKWSDWREEIADGRAYIAPIVSNQSRQSAEHQWDKASTWPKRSRQILVLTGDGLPPRNLQPKIIAVVGEHARWQQCRSLKEVVNIYNLGFWQNLRDVLLN